MLFGPDWFRLEVDEGEEAPVRYTILTAEAPWNDLADATVTLRLRASPGSAGYTSTDGWKDPPEATGRVTGGVVMSPPAAPPGRYRAELEFAKASRPRPVIRQGEILVRERLAKPGA